MAEELYTGKWGAAFVASPGVQVQSRVAARGILGRTQRLGFTGAQTAAELIWEGQYVKTRPLPVYVFQNDGLKAEIKAVFANSELYEIRILEGPEVSDKGVPFPKPEPPPEPEAESEPLAMRPKRGPGRPRKPRTQTATG